MDIHRKISLIIIAFVVAIISIVIFLIYGLSSFPTDEVTNEKEANRSALNASNNNQRDENDKDVLTDSKGREIIENSDGDFVVNIGEVKITDTESPFTEAERERLNAPEDAIIYKIVLNGTWNELSNSSFYPDGAHFSPFISWSHAIEDTLIERNGIASKGVEQMAETGGLTSMNKELEDLKNRGFVYDFSNGKLLFAPGKDELFIEVTETFHLLSVVSMIAPSPDWFIAVRNLDLMTDDNRWIDSITVDAVLYDAGTDSGEQFNSRNRNTRPQERIKVLNNQNIASFTFTRIQN